jgi:hypothetical protein
MYRDDSRIFRRPFGFGFRPFGFGFGLPLLGGFLGGLAAGSLLRPPLYYPPFPPYPYPFYGGYW